MIIRIILILLALLCRMEAGTAIGQEIIEFGSSETPPLCSPALPEDGMAGEILHTISREINVRSVIRYIPIKRLRKDLKHNHLGDPENFAGQEFSSFIVIAVFRSSFFYYRPNHLQGIIYKTLADLKGYTLGVMRGALEDRSYFDKLGIKVEESNSETSLFKKLKNGRIDLCAVIEVSGIFTINKLFPLESPDFEKIEISKSVQPLAIMFDKDYPGGGELGRKYETGLDKIISDGKYKQILEKYYGKGNIPAEWFIQMEKFKYLFRNNWSTTKQ
ncbi:MAG: transporter substrate-binding domain-containing protein [Deltaproteobacteria bacterium]|nr:transporter substrate-binding domain-containing protein [Deltaproteobacteria bacterium]MBF0523991.1 transporter substrate-binding domain-containing protein [Deltaproteobacteria bacterium]